jgi:hypothetical protein
MAEMRIFAIELLMDIAKTSRTKPQDIADAVKVLLRGRCIATSVVRVELVALLLLF